MEAPHIIAIVAFVLAGLAVVFGIVFYVQVGEADIPIGMVVFAAVATLLGIGINGSANSFEARQQQWDQMMADAAAQYQEELLNHDPRTGIVHVLDSAGTDTGVAKQCDGTTLVYTSSGWSTAPGPIANAPECSPTAPTAAPDVQPALAAPSAAPAASTAPAATDGIVKFCDGTTRVYTGTSLPDGILTVPHSPECQ